MSFLLDRMSMYVSRESLRGLKVVLTYDEKNCRGDIVPSLSDVYCRPQCLRVARASEDRDEPVRTFIPLILLANVTFHLHYTLLLTTATENVAHLVLYEYYSKKRQAKRTVN